MNGDRSRTLGRLLMAGAVLQLLVFLAGVARRSYLVIALPLGAGLAVVSALAFWVGYTMAYAEWDDEEEEFPVFEAEPAPAPDEPTAPEEPAPPSEPPSPAV